jgi:hypothetical protein
MKKSLIVWAVAALVLAAVTVGVVRAQKASSAKAVIYVASDKAKFVESPAGAGISGGGSSRASIRGGARCLFSGTGLAGFRLKQLDRRSVRILWVYDTHHALARTGIRVVE